jgi:hypothetical protein
MTTNKNRTATAPTYIMTKIIGINSSPNRNNRPEKQRNDKTKNSTL